MTDRLWQTVCKLEDIWPNLGVCARLSRDQVAIFRFGAGADLYAISNFDPFSRANVLSRGIVGDREGEPKVASPMYKHSFSLRTGRCLDDPEVRVPTYAVRVVDGTVQLKDAPRDAAFDAEGQA